MTKQHKRQREHAEREIRDNFYILDTRPSSIIASGHYFNHSTTRQQQGIAVVIVFDVDYDGFARNFAAYIGAYDQRDFDNAEMAQLEAVANGVKMFEDEARGLLTWKHPKLKEFGYRK